MASKYTYIRHSERILVNMRKDAKARKDYVEEQLITEVLTLRRENEYWHSLPHFTRLPPRET